MVREKAIVLNQEHRVFIFSYSPEVLVQGGRPGIEVPMERLERETLCGDVEKQQLGVLH